MAVYIIEHLEPRMWKWCFMEYEHISKIVGKKNLWITNIKRRNRKIEQIAGRVFRDSVANLKIDWRKACVLDPEAATGLISKDASRFNYFIFGGILGDYPPRKRTKTELSSKLSCKKRNLGKKQLPTDNAAYVVKEVVKGREIKDMAFVNKCIIKINKNEERIFPFCYVVVDGKPLMSKKLFEFVRRKRSF